MYLRKIEGPRTVEVAGGKRMSRADLPDPRTRRWVASRKAAVIRAIDGGSDQPQGSAGDVRVV